MGSPQSRLNSYPSPSRDDWPGEGGEQAQGVRAGFAGGLPNAATDCNMGQSAAFGPTRGCRRNVPEIRLQDAQRSATWADRFSMGANAFRQAPRRTHIRHLRQVGVTPAMP